MYEIRWSAFCCDIGYFGGTDHEDSFADALATWASRNDDYLADGPGGASLYRNGVEIRPAAREWAEKERMRELIAELLANAARGEDWTYIETILPNLKATMQNAHRTAVAAGQKWLNVGNRLRAQRFGGFSEGHAAWLGEAATLAS